MVVGLNCESYPVIGNEINFHDNHIQQTNSIIVYFIGIQYTEAILRPDKNITGSFLIILLQSIPN